MAESLPNKEQWLTIRVGRASMSFSKVGDDGRVLFEPYVMKSGVSVAANLREAFKTASLLLEAPQRVRLVIDSPTLMVPIEMFDEDTMETMYRHAFPDGIHDSVYYNVLPDLNAVAVFAVNRDLKLVIDDHFSMTRIIAAISPVWRHLHQRSFTGPRNKLYGYFHEKRLEVFSFQQNRFKFCNSFDAQHAQDALYFLLYVWRQLQLDPHYDEMHVVGDLPDADWFIDELRKYVQKAYVINPKADFNRAQVTDIKAMPYDLQTLFVKGR